MPILSLAWHGAWHSLLGHSTEMCGKHARFSACSLSNSTIESSIHHVSSMVQGTQRSALSSRRLADACQPQI